MSRADVAWYAGCAVFFPAAIASEVTGDDMAAVAVALAMALICYLLAEHRAHPPISRQVAEPRSAVRIVHTSEQLPQQSGPRVLP